MRAITAFPSLGGYLLEIPPSEACRNVRTIPIAILRRLMECDEILISRRKHLGHAALWLTDPTAARFDPDPLPET